MLDNLVISGIAGRYARCNSIDELRDQLLSNKDLVTDENPRWPPGLLGVPDTRGTIKDIDRFDAQFFGIHGKQVNAMDPQLRILLELVFEVIIDSGINPKDLAGTNTGVFISNVESDTEFALIDEEPDISGLIQHGCNQSMFANRISYHLDLKGPSCSINTACSSAGTAMHQAMLCIRSGQCDAALVCGTCICLQPQMTTIYYKNNMLSPDLKCKFLDQSANGYVRTEACSAILIQKASAAKRCYATIVNIGANVDGYKPEGISFPSAKAQSLLMKSTMEQASVRPDSVLYVEAHGTGTQAGDKCEMEAIVEAYCCHRSEPLLVGSVKSNLGHSESASALTSVAKVLIAFDKQCIPASLHFTKANDNIAPLISGAIKPITQNTKFSDSVVAINSFGFGGSNVHILLKPYEQKYEKNNTDIYNIPKLIPLSGRTRESVEFIMEFIEKNPEKITNDFLKLINNIKNIKGFDYKSFVIYNDNRIEKKYNVENINDKSPLWFVFTGMGCQWTGFGRDLMRIDITKQSLIKSAQVLKVFGYDLIEKLIDDNNKMDDLMDVSVPIVAIQIAFIDLFREIDVSADGFVGHSFGEFACAYNDGCLDRRQTLCLMYWRTKIIKQFKDITGMMAVVNMSWQQCLERCPNGVYPACYNAEDMVTLSGEREAMIQFVDKLKSEGIFVKEVYSCGFAFHTKYMLSVSSSLLDTCRQIIVEPKYRSSKWISTSVVDYSSDSDFGRTASAEYIQNNILSPVMFYSAIRQVPKNATVIELSPHHLLESMVKKSLGPEAEYIRLMKRNNNGDNVYMILSAIGRLYQLGHNPDISKLYPIVSYPVSRGTQSISSLIKWDHSDKWFVAKYPDYFKPSKFRINIDLNNQDNFYLDHRIDEKIIFPATGYIFMIWRILAYISNKNMLDLEIIYEDFQIHQALVLQSDTNLVEFVIYFNDNIFSVKNKKILLCTGLARVVHILKFNHHYLTDEFGHNKDSIILNRSEFYKEIRIRGYEYGKQFQCIKTINSNGTMSIVQFYDNWVTFLDSILQTMILSKNNEKLILPIGFDQLKISAANLSRQFSSFLSSSSSYSKVSHNRKLNLIYIDDCLEIKYLTRVALKSIFERPVVECQKFTPFDKIINIFPKLFNINFKKLIMNELELCLNIIAENKVSQYRNILYLSQQRDRKKKSIVRLVEKYFSDDHYKLDFSEIEKIEQNSSTEHSNVDLIVINMISFIKINILKLKQLLAEDGFVLAILDQVSLYMLGESLKSSSHLENKNIMLITILSSNNYLSVILLKKTSVNPISDQTFVQIKTDSNKWIEILKNKLEVIQKRPKRHNLWLLANNYHLNGIIGLVNCLRKEPGGNRVRCILYDTPTISNEDMACLIRKDLVFNVMCDGKLGSFRYYNHNDELSNLSRKHSDAYLTCNKPGDLSTLTWCPMTVNSAKSRYININVNYCALNFRDIMIATGRLPVDALPGVDPKDKCPLGSEVAGRDSEGRRLVAMVGSKGIATNVCMENNDFVWYIPDKWSMAEACTVPVAYSTAYYALVIRGRMKCGETVLIHSGSGAVGQAAIQIALKYRCKVFATVGSKEKRKFLLKKFPSLDENCLANSRDLSFEYHVHKETNGKGVDLVLNSLSEDKLQASVRCLSHHGRFLEIGKFDLSQNNKLGMSIFLKNIEFHGILLDSLIDYGDSEKIKYEKQALIELITNGLKNGEIVPIKSTIFDIESTKEAFKYIFSGKHIGKVLIKIKEEQNHDSKSKDILRSHRSIGMFSQITLFDPNKSYLIIGGLGGFGLQLIQWMINKGVKKLVINSRNGVISEYQRMIINRIRVSGATCLIDRSSLLEPISKNTIDLADSIAHVSGIFNLAAITSDLIFINQSKYTFDSVCEPKVTVTNTLDIISRRQCKYLDYFVVFSSIVGGRGNAGQTNYGFANSAMERICEKRRKDGLHGLAIQWGAIADVGIVAETMAGNDVIIGDTVPQRIDSCLQVLDRLLQSSESVVGSHVRARRGTKTKYISESDLLSKVCNALGIRDKTKLKPNTTLGQLGMDSLMMAQIRNILEQDSFANLSTTDLLKITVNDLKQIQTK